MQDKHSRFDLDTWSKNYAHRVFEQMYSEQHPESEPLNQSDFFRGYVQVSHDKDVDNSGNAIPVHEHSVDINPYDVPPDDLLEGCTLKPKTMSLGSVIWEELPYICLGAGLLVLVLIGLGVL